MPGTDEELAADIAAADDELAADIAKMETQTPSELGDAIEYGANNTPEEPTPAGPTDVQVKDRAIGDEPWYTQLADTFSPRPDESTNYGASILENLVPFNLADEGQAALMSLGGADVDRPNQGYQGIEPVRPEGGSLEDTRKTLEQEKLERDERAPMGAPTLGRLGAGALEAAAAPLSGPLAAAGTGAALTAANYMGQGSGDIGDRAEQALEMADEHPVTTLASAVLPAAAAGAGKIAQTGAKNLAEASALNRVAAFTTPGQRANLAANKGGKQGLINLGNDVVKANLHKAAPDGPWYKNLLPGSTENMYDNAAALRADAGKRLGEAEDVIAQANPQIETGSIVRDMRGRAGDVLQRSDKEAARAQARFLEEQAAGLEGNQLTKPGTPGPVPVEPQAKPQTPDWLETNSGDTPMTPPSEKEWQDYLLAREQFENPAPVPTGRTDFRTAVADRRFIDDQTNFTPAGGVENAGMKDQVRRQVGTSLRKNIREGLDEAAAANPELAQPVQDWRQANKDFSLASTVEDPALVNMQKEYGGNLGLRDMATATAAQAMGIPGPLAMAAGKVAKGGRGANALAGTQKNLSRAFGAFGTAAGPSTLAATQTALPDPEIVKEKNQSLKDQLAEAASDSWYGILSRVGVK